MAADGPVSKRLALLLGAAYVLAVGALVLREVQRQRSKLAVRRESILAPWLRRRRP